MRTSSSSTLAASSICRIAATITEAGLQAFSRTPVYLAKGIKSTHGDREGEHIAHSTAFRPAGGLILNA